MSSSRGDDLLLFCFQDPSARPISCKIDDTLPEVVNKLTEKHVHRIFVVDEAGLPVGVLSLCDIVGALRGQ